MPVSQKLQILYQEGDIMGAALGISNDRMEAMDFTPPMDVGDHSIMLKYPTFEPDIAGFVKPFAFDVSFDYELRVESHIFIILLEQKRIIC